MATLNALLTGTPGQPPSYSVGMAETFSWVPIENDVNRPLFARASYVTNLQDLTIFLSASDVTIGAVEIKDGNSGLRADVTPVGAGLNGLCVLTQNSVSSADNITIGDKQGNLAAVNNSLSALRVLEVLPISAMYILGTAAVSGSVTVTNPVTSMNVTIVNPASAAAVVSFAHTPNFDAFGRLRTSNPLTLFDSSHRYRDNNLWTSLTAAGGTYAFNQNQGLVDMTVNNLSGSSVIRETTKVFAYQPGKALLVMNTFAMAPSATNLRQRVGYYGQDNGVYLQLDGSTISFVERSLVNGSPSTETIVPLSAWNGDKLDGTGPSGLTLDITKAQIQWMDIEWLGVGTVRAGFIINGQFIVCHSFHHANLIFSTYITTASLPLRYEITNKGATSGSHTLKQVCSTVISEGGYELRGLQQAIGTSVAVPRVLTLASTFYPVVTLRLKATRLDAIVILTAISLLPVTNSAFYEWRLVASGTTSGGAGWVDAGVDSAVEYKLDATSISGGRVLASGFMQGSNQGAPSVDILKEALFKFQLERDGLTSTPYELSLVAATNNAASPIYGSIDWEEISR